MRFLKAGVWSSQDHARTLGVACIVRGRHAENVSSRSTVRLKYPRTMLVISADKSMRVPMEICHENV